MALASECYSLAQTGPPLDPAFMSSVEFHDLARPVPWVLELKSCGPHPELGHTHTSGYFSFTQPGLQIAPALAFTRLSYSLIGESPEFPYQAVPTLDLASAGGCFDLTWHNPPSFLALAGRCCRLAQLSTALSGALVCQWVLFPGSAHTNADECCSSASLACP